MTEPSTGRVLKPDNFGQKYSADDDEAKWSSTSPQESRRNHSRSDVDLSHKALHHTLGPNRNQAAPGNHVHDGTTSKKLGLYELDPVNPGSSRPSLTLPNGYRIEDVVELMKPFIDFRELGGPGYQAGTTLISFASSTFGTATVTFPTTFPQPPSVVTNINHSGSESSRWGSRAINITGSGFQIRVFTGSASDPAQVWTNVPVCWIASLPN